MPGLSDAAKNGRAQLDPDYAKRLTAEKQPLATSPASATKAAPVAMPPNATGQAPDPNTGLMWYHDANGKAISQVPKAGQ